MDALHDQDADAPMTTSGKSPQAIGYRPNTTKSDLISHESSNSPLGTQDGRGSDKAQALRGKAETGEEEQEPQDRRAQLDQDLSIFGFSFRKKKTMAAAAAAAPFKRVASSPVILATREQPPAAGHSVTIEDEERRLADAVEYAVSDTDTGTLPGRAKAGASTKVKALSGDEARVTSTTTEEEEEEEREETISDFQGSDHGEQNEQQHRQSDMIMMQVDQDHQITVNDANRTNSEPTVDATTTAEVRQQLVWRGSWIAPSLIVLRESDLSETKKRTKSSTSLSRKQLDPQQRSTLAMDALAQEGLRPLVQELKGIAMVLSRYDDLDKSLDVSTSPEQPLVADGSMEMHVIAKIELSTFPSYLLDIRHQYGAYEVFVSSNSTEAIHYFRGIFGQSDHFDIDDLEHRTDAHGALLGTHAPQKPLIQDTQMFLVYGVLDTVKSASMDNREDTGLDTCEGSAVSLYAYPLVDHARFSAQSLFNQPVMDRLEAEYIEHQRKLRERRQPGSSNKETEEPLASSQPDDPELEAIMNGTQQLELSTTPSAIMDIDEDESQWEETLLLEALERNRIWKPYTVLPPSSSSSSSQPNPGTPATITTAPTEGLPSRHKALDSLSTSGMAGNKRMFSRSQTMVEAGSGSVTAGMVEGGSGTFSRHQSLDSHHPRRRKGDELMQAGFNGGGSSNSSSGSRRMRETGSSGRDTVTEALRRRLLGPGSIRKSSDQGRLSLPPTKTTASKISLFDGIQEPSSPSRRRQSMGTHRTVTTPKGRPAMRNLSEMLLDHGDDGMEGDEGEDGGVPVFQDRLSRSLLTSPSARTSRARRRVTMGGGGTEGMDLKTAAAQASIGGGSGSRRKSNPPVRMTSSLSRTKSISSQSDVNPFWAPSAPAAGSSSSSSRTPESVSAKDWLSRTSSVDVNDDGDDDDSGNGAVEDGQVNLSPADTMVSTSPVKSLFVYDRKDNAKGKQRAVDMTMDAPAASSTLAEDKPVAKAKAKSIKEQNEHTIKSLLMATLSKHGIREDQKDFGQCEEMLMTSTKFSMRRDIETKLYSLHEVEQVMDRAAALL
ncbi:hypothetical protein DFQ27_002291 [Actinomortierella ambigua]|uniref:Uncharacterized protein n=1 Tax=Actinomortierella ambigua TaxID=1343610 RepID=A0A9P6QB76_9FUNG|nr:hypothetical protein DFQ27_002291 [Actinomortierella ambigua]